MHRVRRIGEQVASFEDTSEDLLKQILFTANNRCGTLDEVANSNPIKDPSICLTFDDGFKSDVEIVLPLLLEAQCKATFFITTDWIGLDGFLLKKDIKKLHESGMQIGSHSKSHINLKYASDAIVKRELKKSKEVLEEIIGVNVNAFSCPFGEHNNRLKRISEELGYQYCCNSKHGLASIDARYFPRNSINRFTRIKELKSLIYPSLKLRGIWFIEDKIKAFLKYFFGKLYFGLRNRYFAGR